MSTDPNTPDLSAEARAEGPVHETPVDLGAVVPGETKPGVYTTEFWVHNALQLVTWLGHAAQGGQLPLKWTVGISALLGIAYKVSRGIAKVGQAYYGVAGPPK